MTRVTLSLLTGVAVLGFASTAFAADLIVDEPAAMPGVVQASGNWDGVYLGVFGGYGSAHYEEDAGYEDDFGGWLVGAALGANFSLGSGLVAGVVGDVAWSDIGGEDGSSSEDINWVGSVRGKLGYDAGTFLPYLTAGLAVAGTTVAFSGTEDSATHIGWTVGAGAEVAVADNMSLDVLYRYSDYGSQTYNTGGSDFDAGFTSHQITVGLNWKF